MENLAPILVASSLEAVRKTYGLPPISATLGEGSYGVVRSIGHLALKKFRVDDDEEGLDSSSIREIGVYQYLTKHAPHIVPKAVSVIIDDVHSNGAILMEKYPYTLHTSPNEATADKFVSIARSLIEKLCTWSKLGLSHRDLKPQNIVVDPDSSDLRIIDWGAASFNHWSSPEYGLTTDICTLWYRCPEILLGAKHYNPVALDIWSVAASLIHVWSRIKSGAFNLAGNSEIDVLMRIFELVGSPTSEAMKKLPVWSDKLPNFPTRKVSKTWKLPDDQLADLIDKMFVTDPCDRLTIDDIMRHPFMIPLSPAIVIPVIPCRKRSNIMSHQTDINWKMRQILIDWLIEVSVKFKLKMETLLFAVEIIDDMLLRKLYIRQKFQLLGVTALLIAGKLLEISSPDVSDYVYIADNAYPRGQLLDCETTILMTIPDLYTIMARGPAHIAAKTVANSNALMWISVLLSIYDGTSYSTDNVVSTIVSVYNAADGGDPIAPGLESLFPKSTKSSLVSARKILSKLATSSAIIGALDVIFFKTPEAPVVAPLGSVVPDKKSPLPSPISIHAHAHAHAPAPASAMSQKIRIIIKKKDTPVPQPALELLILAP